MDVEDPGEAVIGAHGSPRHGPTPGGMTAPQAGRAEVGGVTLIHGQIKGASEAETTAGTETAWGMGLM